MSEKRYSVKSEILHVPMRDGVKLSVHVHRPDADGEFPAIVQYTPYRKEPLGGHHPIVEHGYATVTFDIRGTGNSEGWNDSIYSEAERQDGYDMVEWAACQSWCNGNVGMWGISFGAVVSLQIAGMAPPHLKAIIARSGSDDPYFWWTNPGGSPRPYMYANYSPLMTAMNFSPPDPDEVGERWAAIWAERLEKNVPWGIAFIRNLLGGPFWRERALRGSYDNVRCAVFVVGGWNDWYPTPLLRIFSGLKVPSKALVGPWSHQWPDTAVPGPRINWLREALKWFDYWLKGIDNGVMDEPPLTLFVREYSPPATLVLEEKGDFRCENEWPPARAEETVMYFIKGGYLSSQSPSEQGCDVLNYDPRVGATTGLHGGGPLTVNWFMPLDQRPDEARSLTYTSESLQQDIEVTGQPRAILSLSLTADVAMVAVKFCDVAPDGTSALVTKGYVNVACHDSYSEPSSIEPGKSYEITVELLACAWVFRKGHRIRVSIAGADFLNLWPTPKPYTATLYLNAEHPSRIILPIVPAQDSPLPAPDLQPSPHPNVRREHLRAPKYSIGADPVNETAIVSYEVNSGEHGNAARFTVSANDPARAVLDAEAFCRCGCLGQEIVTKARCVTSSDVKAFHHSVHVAITMDGKPYWSKQWAVSVPRRFM